MNNDLTNSTKQKEREGERERDFNKRNEKINALVIYSEECNQSALIAE